MFKFFRLLCVMVCTLFVVSCAQHIDVRSYGDFLAKLRMYSEVEPKGNQPKAKITVIQLGQSDFYSSGIRVYDLANKDEKGYLRPFRFGDSSFPDRVSDIQGVVVPDDLVRPLNQINIVPNKPFIFGTSVSKTNIVAPGWFSNGYAESFSCKWNFQKFAFIPKAGKNYLLSIGAKRTEDEKKFLCIFKLEEWNKKAKQYQNVPFMLYFEK
jgi:hypothetical protein